MINCSYLWKKKLINVETPINNRHNQETQCPSTELQSISKTSTTLPQTGNSERNVLTNSISNWFVWLETIHPRQSKNLFNPPSSLRSKMSRNQGLAQKDISSKRRRNRRFKQPKFPPSVCAGLITGLFKTLSG